jgi:hypothetical protein
MMVLAAVGRPRRVQWVGPPVTVAVDRVHHDLVLVLIRWRVREDVIDDVVTVVTALLDNVVRHARTDFSVAVELSGPELRVTVHDDLAGAAPRGTPRLGGRPPTGLRLVNATALRWGWYEQDVGKTVWAEFLA